MNDLPDGWEWTTLGDIAEVVGGVTKDSKKQADPSLAEVPYLRVANVQRGYLDLQEVTKIRVAEATLQKLRLLPGDILFNEGGDRDKLGRGWVWEGQVPDCIHQNHVFRARIRPDEYDPKFISMYGNSVGRKWFEDHGKQTVNLASISLSTLKALPVPRIPLYEQRKIVAAIEEEFSRLDAGVAALERVSHNQKRLRVSLMQAVILGRLPITVQDIEVSAQQVPLAVAPMKRRAGRLWGSGSVPQLTKEERTSIPAHWQWSKVSELGKEGVDTVQVGPMSMRSADFVASGIPVLNVGSVQWDWIDESKLNYLPPAIANSFSRYRIQPGDVLFTRSGTVGRAAVAEEGQRDWLMTFHLLRVRVDSSVCLPEYLRMIFESAPHVRRQARGAAIGTTRAGFNTRLLAELDVPLPPLPEQVAIVHTVQLHLTRILGINFSILTRKSQLLRSSILTAAFSGKLVPKDPNDESDSSSLQPIEIEPYSANGHKTIQTRRTPGMRGQVTA